MARLASRSPAAPFSTSRPAPVKPQRPPQSTTTTEAQTLRQMVQEREEEVRELEEEIERLRDAIKRVRGYNADIRDGKINYRPQDHIDVLDNALDGGGGDHE